MHRFDRLVNRMDAVVQRRLGNGCASYKGPAGGSVTTGIEVVVDPELMKSGAEGIFRSESVGFTWRKSQLSAAERGGEFVLCGRRYVVEDQISDDGHMVAAACMELK